MSEPSADRYRQRAVRALALVAGVVIVLLAAGSLIPGGTEAGPDPTERTWRDRDRPEDIARAADHARAVRAILVGAGVVSVVVIGAAVVVRRRA